MIPAAEFQRICNDICERLGRDRYDPEAFELMHSPEFTLSCAWMGIDPEEAFERLARIAAQRKEAAARA